MRAGGRGAEGAERIYKDYAVVSPAQMLYTNNDHP